MKCYQKYLLFGLSCTIFGSTFLAIGLGLKAGASPLFFAALRFLGAGALMLPSLLLFKRVHYSSIRPLLFRSALLSLFLTVGSFGCMFIAQTKVDSGLMARLDATGPLITAVFASVLLGKKLKSLHIAALFTGTAGVFFIASPAAWTQPLYILFAFASIVFYALGNAIYPRLFNPEDDPVLISALQSFIGGFILLILAVMTEQIQFPLKAVGPLIYLTLGGSIIAHSAVLVLIRDAGPVFASSWLYVAPVIATVLGAVFLNESVSPAGTAGIILALSGVFLLDLAEKGSSSAAVNRE